MREKTEENITAEYITGSVSRGTSDNRYIGEVRMESRAFHELRFELRETEGIFKNKNFGRLSQRRYSPKYTNIGVQTQGRGIV